MRRIVTPVLVLGSSLAIAGATAGTAQAKGEFGGPITARATISGPGLRTPIVLAWHGDCGLVYGCSDLAQMDVEDEPGRRYRLRPGHRSNLHHIPAARPVPGCDRAAVDHQAAHLGEWHSQRLHDMTQRGDAVAGNLDCPATVRRLEEQPQLSRDTHQRLWPAHPSSMPDERAASGEELNQRS